MASNLHLTWRKQPGKVMEGIYQLYRNQSYTDVTLKCPDGTVKCHKTVLVTCSTYFRDLLAQHPFVLHPIISLDDIKIEVLKEILDWMYCGQVVVSVGRIVEMMDAAKILGVRGLALDEDEFQLKSPQVASPQPNDSGGWLGMMTSPPVSPFMDSKPFLPGGEGIGSARRTVLGEMFQDVAEERKSPLWQIPGLTITLLRKMPPKMEPLAHHQQFKKIKKKGQSDSFKLEPMDLRIDMDHDIGKSKVSKECAKYKQYSPEKMKQAVEEVKQLGLSCIKVAKKFDVPARTLYDRVKKYRDSNTPTDQPETGQVHPQTMMEPAAFTTPTFYVQGIYENAAA